MKNRLPKRLSAWLLTLVMLMGMLPAMASADEVDEDLSPPAPQEENYGYVRLVFAEGEQLDLCHGEYITECSPTAEILSGADEDFIANGEYAALYYEGKLYCKATLDGVSIDADAVLPAEDFALVPMGEALTTLSEEREDETPPAVEVVEPEGRNSGSNETVGTPPSTEPESKEEDKTTEDEVDPSGSDYNVGADTQPQGPMRVPVMPTATGESGYIGVVNYDDNKIFFERMYDNSYLESMLDVGSDGKFDFEKHTGSGAPSQYVLWYTGGVLHMKNYNGGGISTGNSKHLTILVEADSTITGDDQGCIDLEGSLGQYHNVTISSDNDSKLTLNMNGSYGTAAAINSDGGNRTESTVTIEGSVKVEANVYNSSSSNGAMAFGIEARDVIIRNSASFKAVCSTEAQKNSDIGCYGIVANGTLTVNTTGTIDIDVSHASADDRAYSVGLRGESVDLQQVKYMKIKWAKGYLGKYGAAIYPKRTAINNHAVGYPDDTTAIYRYGTPHKVVLTDCSITSAKDRSGKTLYTKGTFLLRDRLTVEADNHGIGVVGWYTNPDSFPDSPAASGSTLVYQVPATGATEIRIKPLYRLGETGGLSFEWTGADTGRVRLKLRESYGIDPNEIKLLDRTGDEVASGATYDYTSDMLSMEVGNIQKNGTYRIKTSHTKAKVDLYSDWFKAISVPAPTIDKPSGRYYGSMNVNVTPQPDTKVFYKTGSAEIYSGSEGTAFSGDPIAVDGTNSSLTLRARKSDEQGVTIWSTPVTATWTKLGTLPVPEVTFSPTENYTLDAATNTVTVTGPITATLSKPSTWPINAEMVSSDSMAPIPNCSPYQTPYNYDGTKDGYLRVGTRAKQADGKYEYESALYKIRPPVTNKLWLENCTATVDGNPVINGAGVEVGKTVILTPRSEGVTFKEWYSSDVTLIDLGNNTCSFVMPDKAVSVKAIVYANEYTSMTVIFDVYSGSSIVSNMSGIRHTVSGVDGATTEITFYKGNTPYNNGALDKNSGCYRAHITCSAAENAIFSDNMKLYANCKVNSPYGQLLKGGFTLSSDKKTLEFDVWLVFAPEVTVPLYEGESKPTAEQCTTQPGIKVTSLTWSGNTIQEMKIKDEYLVGDSCSLFRLAANPKVWINGVLYDAKYDYEDAYALTVKNTTIPTVPKGVKVSGTAVSWNNTDNALYLLYNSSTSDADIKADMKLASPVKALAYTATKGGITANADGKRYDQTFSFSTVPAGTYKLAIFKPGHGVWIESIAVDSIDITDKNIELYLWGDVNKSGTVNSTDAMLVLRSGSSLTGYQKVLADVNGNGAVNATDAMLILRHKSSSVFPVETN